MPTEVEFTSKGNKGKKNLNKDERDILKALVQDLRETGGKPYNRGWHNLGPVKQLGADAMHCHLHRRQPEKVVVWRVSRLKGKKGFTTCTIEYVGTREKAPF